MYATRLGSPLIAAAGEGETFIASDVPAILPYSRRYALIGEKQIVRIDREGISLFEPDGSPAKLQMLTAEWSVEQAQKSGYDHFMLKEIYEQPARSPTRCIRVSRTACPPSRRRTTSPRGSGGSSTRSPLWPAAPPCTRA